MAISKADAVKEVEALFDRLTAGPLADSRFTPETAAHSIAEIFLAVAWKMASDATRTTGRDPIPQRFVDLAAEVSHSPRFEWRIVSA